MMFCVGSMCGYLISGFLSDRYGRRPTIAFLSGLAAFSNVFPLVIRSDIAIMSARFLAGISADTVCSIVFLLGKYFVALNVSVLYVATLTSLNLGPLHQVPYSVIIIIGGFDFFTRQ